MNKRVTFSGWAARGRAPEHVSKENLGILLSKPVQARPCRAEAEAPRSGLARARREASP